MSDREPGIPGSSESGQEPSLATATQQVDATREAPGAKRRERKS